MKGRKMLGILGPAAALIGAGAVGWALCKAASDADERLETMRDQAWIHDAKARAAVKRAQQEHPCSRPANVITFPSRRPYDWQLDEA